MLLSSHSVTTKLHLITSPIMSPITAPIRSPITPPIRSPVPHTARPRRSSFPTGRAQFRTSAHPSICPSPPSPRLLPTVISIPFPPLLTSLPRSTQARGWLTRRSGGGGAGEGVMGSVGVTGQIEPANGTLSPRRSGGAGATV